MRLGGEAAYLLEIQHRDELPGALDWAAERQLPVVMIGSGSNIVWRDEGFGGLVLVNKIAGYDDGAADDTNHLVIIGAGESWDTVVARTVQAGLSGIEALSLIPGSAGATPVQNVGAYGCEIADTLVSLEAYDTHTRSFVTIPAAECAFGYRTSRFKVADKGRFYITSLTLHLVRGNPVPPFYGAVQEYFDRHGVTSPTPQTLRDAVVSIRTSKLPDPAVVANNGSFFANPIVDEGTLAQLVATYSAVPHWPTDRPGCVKLSAAWLIEHAGFKDYHDRATGMATWPAQPLVFVNEHARSTADLLAFKQKIVSAVRQQFGIALEQESELLP